MNMLLMPLRWSLRRTVSRLRARPLVGVEFANLRLPSATISVRLTFPPASLPWGHAEVFQIAGCDSRGGACLPRRASLDLLSASRSRETCSPLGIRSIDLPAALAHHLEYQLTCGVSAAGNSTRMQHAIRSHATRDYTWQRRASPAPDTCNDRPWS